KTHGRIRNTYYREADGIKLNVDTMNLEGDNENSIYYNIKTSIKETLTEPYYYSYTKKKKDEVLESSVAIPITYQERFVGLVGIDLNLERFQKLIEDIIPYKQSTSFFVSNKGLFVAHQNLNYIGKSIFDVCSDYAEKEKLEENIEIGRSFSYVKINDDGSKSYITYSPVTIGNTNTPWSLAVSVPEDVILHEANREFMFSMIVGMIGMFVLVILIYLIADRISSPLKKATIVLKRLAKGEIDVNKKLKIESKDEVGEISSSVNTLIDALDRTALFAEHIGKGKLDVEYNLLSEKDTLGSSLLEMRESLTKAKEEDKKRIEEESIQSWTTNGLAKFGEILRKYNNDINELSFQVLSNLLNYVEAIQGIVFILNDEDKNERYYEVTSAIAYDRPKRLTKKIKEGEELVGRCAFEQLTIYMIDVPDDYVNITSGLGQANPNCILLVPLVANEEVLGVIEIVSFKQFEKYKIEFVEKIAETVASTVASVKINQRTAQLLEQSQQQSEELAAQEEEMRQNMEELQATQEEMQRKEENLKKTISELQEDEKE
ncbi:GAF domain-containing protein, partial [Bacteroidota bacterium]